MCCWSRSCLLGRGRVEDPPWSRWCRITRNVFNLLSDQFRRTQGQKRPVSLRVCTRFRHRCGWLGRLEWRKVGDTLGLSRADPTIWERLQILPPGTPPSAILVPLSRTVCTCTCRLSEFQTALLRYLIFVEAPNMRYLPWVPTLPNGGTCVGDLYRYTRHVTVMLQASIAGVACRRACNTEYSPKPKGNHDPAIAPSRYKHSGKY